MKFKKIFSIAAGIILFSTVSAYAQEIEIIKFNQLQEIIDDKSHDIKVINFWATWCRPCIKEIPYFENVNSIYEEDQVKVILVSFDFLEELEKSVLPFIRKRNIQSEVKLLDETDFNAFINKIDPAWSGAIPATLIVNNKSGEHSFFEKEFKKGELKALIEGYLNN